MENQELVRMAQEAMKNAYVPYSNFSVGAALLGSNGKVYTGCNVENASFGATVCAERTAVFKAVSDGCRKFEKIAIVGSQDRPTAPCGICRQVLSEFCDASFPVLMAAQDGSYEEQTLGKLFDRAFSLDESCI